MIEPLASPGAWLPVQQWEACTPPFTFGANVRNADAYQRAVLQFDVDHHPRYRPGKPGPTWCNIFLWDVSRAFAAEIPHWIRGKETTASEVVRWLDGRLQNGGALQGPEHGWREVKEPEARARALDGFPTVVGWENPNPKHSGHVGIVMPGTPGDRTWIAQAGASCFSFGPLSRGFGQVSPIRFFTHN